MRMRALTYVEIDVDWCALLYGEAPCMAAVGDTGDRKCFNTFATCQDRENFDKTSVTLRFAEPKNYLPRDIDAIPSITGISFTPAIVSLGKDLGQRASLSVTFEDHRWKDIGDGFDKYWRERDFDSFERGTFWGRFRARQPYLRGRRIRIIRGYVGQSLEEMDTRHYLIDSFDGPSPNGSYTITAKDVLKALDGDRAQAPRLSNGFLSAAIAAGATTATLAPAGVGNAEYPASGFVAIGGEEICGFTRSGNTLSLTRGQLGTSPAAHNADDRVQLVLRYVAQSPADIISDLLQTYAEVPAEYIPLGVWQDEVTEAYGQVMTATLPEPTAVKQLVSEIIEQAGLALWWDDLEQRIRLRVLRAIVTDATRYGGQSILEGTLATREQPGLRRSQVWTYFGMRNPLERIDDPDNYRSSAATVAIDEQEAYGQPSIHKIYSRWIPAFGRPIALRLNDIILSRFTMPPRRFNFDLFRTIPEPPQLGQGCQIEWPFNQDETGEAQAAPAQITRLNPLADRFQIEAEEMLFGTIGSLEPGTIIIDSNALNLNLRSIYNSLYGQPDPSIPVTCIIEAGVLVGATSTLVPAFNVGSWPTGVSIRLVVRGRIQGAGGRGGGGCQIYIVEGGVQAIPGTNGLPGGAALYTRYPVTLAWGGGAIWGGAGGGGGGGEGITSDGVSFSSGGGGGGGQGNVAAIGGPGGNVVFNYVPEPGGPSTVNSPGLGGRGAGLQGDNRGGHGGTAGNPGGGGLRHTFRFAGADPGAGGPAGFAINGSGFVTVEGSGDFRGPTI